MKSWPETIRLTHSLRHVVLCPAGADPSPSFDWQAECQAAYERGRNDGEQALGEQLLQQRQEVQELARGTLETLRKAVPQVIRDTEQHLIELTLQIAQKLVGDLPISGEMVEAAVREALAEVEGTGEFHIRVHPTDLELLRKMDSSLLSTEDASRHLRFHSSPDVTRGGCLVQTRFGTLDAQRETKLDLLKRALVG